MRVATPRDARDIARARGQSWRAAYAHIFGVERLETISEDDDAAFWGRWLSEGRPGFEVFVATQGEGVIGFASHGPERSETSLVELYAIYVHPESWGRGAGRALMEATLAGLREKGFEEAILWVLEENRRTRRFYELAGWHADGGVKEEEWLGISVREVRYRIALR